ncbi:MAG: hypothetical protein ABSE82_05805 [Nitrososphaerales archaeon]|jgi:hypothetical protein
MTPSEQIREEKSHAQARQIFSTLANEDALRIFGLAASGIEASKCVLVENHFSKKRYYVRLGELVEIGLVAKEKGVYRHTILGSIVYENQVASLQRILAKRGSLEILNELKNRNKSDESLRSAVSGLSQQVLKDVETSIGLSNLKPVRLMRTWNDFFAQVNTMLDSTRKDVCIGTRTFDTKLARAALKAAERGCMVDIMHNRIREFNPSDNKNMKYQEEILDLLNALRSHSNVRLRRSSIPYSFFVFDKLDVAIEITHPEAQESYFLGVSFQSPTAAATLASFYQEIAKSMKIDTISPMIGTDEMLRIR